MRLAAALLLFCACLPQPGGQCSNDLQCALGPPGSFCAEGVCQGPPLGALEAVPGRIFTRGETLHLRLRVRRAHGFATARALVAGLAVGAQPDPDGALGVDVPLSLAPAGAEGPVAVAVELRDDLGHTASFPLSVAVDDLPPRVSFDPASVPAAAVLRGSRVSLRLTAKDLAGVTIDGATRNADGSFTLPADTALAAPGDDEMTVEAAAVDGAGNRSTVSAKFPLTRVKWSAHHPDTRSIQSLVLTDTRVMTLANENEFWFLDRETGRPLARPAVGGTAFPRIATDGSRLFFGRTDDMLCRLLPDGSLQSCCGPYPKLSSGPIVFATPSFGTVAIGATGLGTSQFAQRLIAVPDLGSDCGTPIVSLDRANFGNTEPAIAADGTVYAGAAQAIISAQFDGLVFGSHLTAEPQNYFDQPAFRDDGTVLLANGGSIDTFTFQKPPTTAMSRASKSLGTSSLAPTIAADGTALVAVDNSLFAVHPDGSIRWSRVFADQLTAPPAAGAAEIVYAGMLSGKVLALSLQDGSTVWSYDAGAPIRGSLAPGCDGVLYAGFDGGVVALVTGAKGLADSPWPKAGHDVRNTGDARRPLRSSDGSCLE